MDLIKLDTLPGFWKIKNKTLRGILEFFGCTPPGKCQKYAIHLTIRNLAVIHLGSDVMNTLSCGINSTILDIKDKTTVYVHPGLLPELCSHLEIPYPRKEIADFTQHVKRMTRVEDFTLAKYTSHTRKSLYAVMPCAFDSTKKPLQALRTRALWGILEMDVRRLEEISFFASKI